MNRPYVTTDGMTAQKAYDSINKWWFGNKLPKVKIRWPKYMLSEKPCRFGWAVGTEECPKEIHLNPRFRCYSGVWLRTLFHEIVHIEQWGISDEECHGPKFERRMRQLARLGAFNGLW